jgi:hypothetical protein
MEPIVCRSRISVTEGEGHQRKGGREVLKESIGPVLFCFVLIAYGFVVHEQNKSRHCPPVKIYITEKDILDLKAGKIVPVERTNETLEMEGRLVSLPVSNGGWCVDGICTDHKKWDNDHHARIPDFSISPYHRENMK